MTTKIGIELPSDLLDAARIAQISNRNKLSLRELNNKTKKEAARKIKNLPVMSKEDLWKGAVPEYKTDLFLPKGLPLVFSWVGIQRTVEFNSSEIKPDPCGQINYSYSKDYTYVFFSSIRIKRDPYFKNTKLSYFNNFDINENWTSADSIPTLEAYEEEKITKSMFYDASSSTASLTANIDTSKLLDISIAKTILLTGEYATTGSSDCGELYGGPQISYYQFINQSSYSLELYFSISNRVGDCFLYVVWKESYSDLMNSNAPARYFFGDASDTDNHLGGATIIGSTRLLSITYWDNNGGYIGSPLNFKATKKIDGLNDSNIFAESLLPNKLRGLMTMIYDVGYVRDYTQNLGCVKFSFNALPMLGVTNLAERFLFFVLPKNYAQEE